jgi:hypothetical protein
VDGVEQVVERRRAERAEAALAVRDEELRTQVEVAEERRRQAEHWFDQGERASARAMAAEAALARVHLWRGQYAQSLTVAAAAALDHALKGVEGPCAAPQGGSEGA